MKLHEFIVHFVHDGNGYSVPIYAATAKAAREAAAAYVRDNYPGAYIRRVEP